MKEKTGKRDDMATVLREMGYANSYEAKPDHVCEVEMVDVENYPKMHKVRCLYVGNGVYHTGSYGGRLVWWREIPDESGRRWHIYVRQKPERNGCYEIMDSSGARRRERYEESLGGGSALGRDIRSKHGERSAKKSKNTDINRAGTFF